MKSTQTIKELSTIYDELYSQADALFKEYNPCQFNKQTGSCKVYQEPSIYHSFILCCSGCHNEEKRKHQHSKKSGCRIKSLNCKLYLCYSIHDKMPQEFKRKLADLRLKAFEAHFQNGYFRTKKWMIQSTWKYLHHIKRGRYYNDDNQLTTKET